MTEVLIFISIWKIWSLLISKIVSKSVTRIMSWSSWKKAKQIGLSTVIKFFLCSKKTNVKNDSATYLQYVDVEFLLQLCKIILCTSWAMTNACLSKCFYSKPNFMKNWQAVWKCVCVEKEIKHCGDYLKVTRLVSHLQGVCAGCHLKGWVSRVE